MTEFPGAADDNSGYDGNTILLECEDNEYIYIPGLDVFKFKPNEKIIDYISLVGNNAYTYGIINGVKIYIFDRQSIQIYYD